MAPIPSTSVPGTIVAGDSIMWQRAFSDYPAIAGWTLAYTLVGETSVYHLTADAGDDRFVVNVAASVSKQWTPGPYRMVEAVSNGDQRITLNATPLTIAPDPATGIFTPSHAAKLLALINAWLESRAPVAGATEINGRRIQYYPIADLLKMRDRYAQMVAREQAAPGQLAGARILVRL